MAKEHYFDITAKLDMMELKNALIMAEKEVATRFDFKGLKAEFNLNESAKTLSLSSSSDSKIDALKDILISKLIKRGIAGKALEEVKTEGISGGNTKVIYRIVDTIDKDEAKNSNTGLSFTYSKLWKDRFIIHLTGARHKGKVFDESVAKFSLYMFI
jgi:uncharacterized protein YajQ (UPF0234 family)